MHRQHPRIKLVIITTALMGYAVAPALSQDVTDSTASVVRTIDTSLFPSPDPSGLSPIPGSEALLLSDSEINETPLFAGENLFQIGLDGTLLETNTTFPNSDEPSGVELVRTSAGLTLFVADDAGGARIYVIELGPDELLGTADDSAGSFSTGLFGSFDPEGITFAHGNLFVSDGAASQVFQIQPGPNGNFDGVDDRVVSFDTVRTGVITPEGVAYNQDNGHLYIVGKPSNIIAEVTTRGALVQTIDIAAANGRHFAGAVYTSSSVSPNQKSLYIADRRVDNNSDPSENDGKIYEVTVPTPVMSARSQP